MAEKKIGLLVGDEWSWPTAFKQEVERRRVGISVEMVKLAGTRLAASCPYQVIIDRISYEIPYYRTFLKTAVLNGTTVINNPFWNSAHDRFFNANLVHALGFRHPRMVALPSHSYLDGVLDDSLRNLVYPIPWDQHIDYLGGFPVVLRPIRDTETGYKVSVINSQEDLWYAYNKSGAEPMMLREHMSWDKYVRCFYVSRDRIHPVEYRPGSARGAGYSQSESRLSAEERDLICQSAIRINTALGYDINTLDFAFKDGELYAVDVTNPVPDFDVNAITPYFFDWVVKAVADYAIELVLTEYQQRDELPWKHEFSEQMQDESQAVELLNNGCSARRSYLLSLTP